MTEPVRVTIGDVDWRIAPEWRDLLLGPTGLRLDEWLATGQAQIVKHGPHRTVYRVTLPALDCFVKRNRLMNARAWLRELIRPAKACIEHTLAEQVAARGVPTITPIAVGHGRPRRGPGESFLVTHSLDDTEQLDHFLTATLATFPPPQQARLRQRVALALGAFLARMHDAGIVHHDLHPGNLLVRLQDDRPEFFLVDLHAVRLHPPLDWPTSRDNLVILNRWFTMRADRSDRLRFWRSYCRERRTVDVFLFPLSVVRKELPVDVEARTRASNLQFWRSRDRRCLASNRYFQPVRSPSVFGHAVRDLNRDVLGALLADPDAPFTWPGVKLLKDSRSSTVAELDIHHNGQTLPVIYKRFRITTWSDPWVALLRRSPALRSWVHGHGLRERCLPTPRPLLVLHRRRGGLACEGYLLTEKVTEAAELHDFLAGLSPLSDAERRGSLRGLIDQVAGLIRAMHERRLAHRDLKAANLLVRHRAISPSPLYSGERGWGEGVSPLQGRLPPHPQPLSPEYRGEGSRNFGPISLIDLVGVSRYEELPRARRVKDLTRLNASFHQSAALTRTDRLRFLRVYLQWGLFGRGSWKRWWRDIEVATAAKVARNARRGRILA